MDCTIMIIIIIMLTARARTGILAGNHNSRVESSANGDIIISITIIVTIVITRPRFWELITFVTNIQTERRQVLIYRKLTESVSYERPICSVSLSITIFLTPFLIIWHVLHWINAIYNKDIQRHGCLLTVTFEIR